MGQNERIVYSFLENLIIKIYSLFDLLTKLLIEIQTLYSDWTKWPKLKSSDQLYGNRNRYIDVKMTNTIFYPSKVEKLIMNLRHDIIHNGSLECQNKIYCKCENGSIVGKYIMLVDTNDGCLDSVKNRKRFFSKTLYLNIEFPEIYIEVMTRLMTTLKEIAHLTKAST